MSRTSLRDTGAKAIAPVLPKVKYLELLNMSHCEVRPGGSEVLAEYIRCVPGLRVFQYAQNTASSGLMQSLCGCFALQRLHLPQMEVSGVPVDWDEFPYDPVPSGEALKEVAHMIGELSELQELRLPWPGVTGTSVKAFAEHMTQLTSVREITMHGGVTSEGAHDLATLVSGFPCPETFSGKCEGYMILDEWDAQIIALAPVIGKLSTLRYIDLHDVIIDTSHSADALGYSIQALTNLETLRLSPTFFKTCSSEVTQSVLISMPHLKHIDLCELGFFMRNDREVDDALRAISMMSSLEKLLLWINQPQEQHVLSLALQFSRLSSFLELDLSGTVMRRGAVHALSKHLCFITSLQKLFLRDAEMRDEEFAVLAPSVGNLFALLTLDVSGNYLTCKSVPILISQTKYLAALQEQYLDNNAIGDLGA